jgi:hypothetical protein
MNKQVGYFLGFVVGNIIVVPVIYIVFSQISIFASNIASISVIVALIITQILLRPFSHSND